MDQNTYDVMCMIGFMMQSHGNPFSKLRKKDVGLNDGKKQKIVYVLFEQAFRDSNKLNEKWICGYL